MSGCHRRRAWIYWRWTRRQPILKLGALTSLVWVPAACLLAVILAKSGALEPNNFGDFLSGLFAPLAFMWLALGLLAQMIQLRLQRIELRLQRKELALQREEVKRLADEAARQAAAVEANEAHARRDTFMRLAELLNAHLNYLCCRMCDGVRGSVDNYHASWDVYSRGNHDVFFEMTLRVLMNARHDGSFVQRIGAYFGDTRMIFEFCDRVEYLLEEAERCRDDAQLRRAYESSHLGTLYVFLCQQIDRKPTVKFIRSDLRLEDLKI